MPDLLTTALDAAKLGSEKALSYFDKDIDVEYKSDNTPVTIADKEAEKTIRKRIMESFPNAKFVGEEGGGDLKQDEFWIIDPIDGTRHFSRGIPSWRILIGYVKVGSFELGVSYSPFETGTVWAQKGKGTFTDGKRTNVSGISRLSEALMCNGNPKYFTNKQSLLKLIEASGSVRSFDTGYSQALVAMGKVDVSVDSYGAAWDVAPYIPIIQEAGGKITNLQGGTWSFEDVGCIATNGLLHDEVVQILNS